MEDNLTTQLSEIEKAEFETLEGVIEREMGSFMAVGNALIKIRDPKLYREQFRNFKEYCAERWGMSRQYSYNLMSGSQVATNLSAHADNFSNFVKIQPTSEYQVRPLTVLEQDQQCEVWEEAVRLADGKVVTFRQVKALVAELVGLATPTPEKKKDPYAHSDANYYVSLAIIHLEKIRDDDPLRVEAVGRISEWIQEKLIEWTKK